MKCKSKALIVLSKGAWDNGSTSEAFEINIYRLVSRCLKKDTSMDVHKSGSLSCFDFIISKSKQKSKVPVFTFNSSALVLVILLCLMFWFIALKLPQAGRRNHVQRYQQQFDENHVSGHSNNT